MDGMSGYWELADALESDRAAKSAQRRAVVSRVDDDGTVYVRFPGSSIDMPVHSCTVSVAAGDEVSVSIARGRAAISGNHTDPAASSVQLKSTTQVADTALQDAGRAASAANMAESEALRAHDAADSAQASADAASDSLKSVVQGATTVEKAVSVMQTALESVVDYDPTASSSSYAGDGTTMAFTLPSAGAVTAVTVGGTTMEEGTDYTTAVSNGYTVVTFATAPAADAAIVVTHETLQEWFWHDANGAHVLGDTSGYRNDITSTGMDIKQVSTEASVARFGADGAQIGLGDESHIEQDYHSMKMVDKEGNAYFYVSDLRAASGKIEQTDTFTGDGSTTKFYLSYVSDTTDYAITMVQTFTGNGSTKAFTLNQHAETTDYTVSVGGSVVTSGVTKEETTVTFATAPANGAAIVVTYDLTYMPTFIVRHSTYVDFHPTIFGVAPLATCTFSITYTCSDDENKAFTFGSRAQGIVGASSVSIGTGNLAAGTGSIALGTGLITTSSRQMVIGRYNRSVGGAVIVGGGTATTDRKNIARIDWSGNATLAGGADISGDASVNGVIQSELRSKGGSSWVKGAAGEAALYVPKPANNMNSMVGALAVQTTSGGGWIVGNYNNESLVFEHFTATNINSQTNSPDLWFGFDPAFGYTTTASNIATAATNFTIQAAEFCQFGKIAQVYLNIKSTNAIGAGNITNIEVATLVSGKWPKMRTAFSLYDTGPLIGGSIRPSDGKVHLAATEAALSAGSSFNIVATYILA